MICVGCGFIGVKSTLLKLPVRPLKWTEPTKGKDRLPSPNFFIGLFLVRLRGCSLIEVSKDVNHIPLRACLYPVAVGR